VDYNAVIVVFVPFAFMLLLVVWMGDKLSKIEKRGGRWHPTKSERSMQWMR
jgi:hypothetical protein